MTKPLVTNAANEKQVKKAGETVKFVRNRELEDIRTLLNTKEGKRFFWRYLTSCGVFRSSYDPSGSKVYHNEGIRQVGLELLADVTEASPEVFAQMMLANHQMEESND